MTIEAVIALSRPYRGRKYPNMTVLQRLRCDLYAEAADYDHTMMHARSPYQQRQATVAIGDELVTITQNYAWRYAKHRQMDVLQRITDILNDARILDKATALKVIEIEMLQIVSDLSEYQEQHPNMKLM